MMERNKNPMKLKKVKKEAKAKKVREADDDGDMAGGMDPGNQDHADAAQDVALFKKMISQYLGNDGGGVDGEEAMKMAKHAHEHFMKQGMEAHEAYEAAGNHLKASAAIGKAMSQEKHEESHEEEEAHEEAMGHEEEAQESEEHEEAGDGDGQTPPAASGGKKGASQPMAQESNKQLIALKAQVASLKESVRKTEVRNYLDKKLAASNRSPEFIKAFREALGAPRSVAHVEEIWGVFTKAADAASADGFESDDQAVFTENSSGRFRESDGDNVISFKDCVK